MNTIPAYSAIVLAAGQGTRTGLSYNKIFLKAPDGQTVLEMALAPFLADPACTGLVVTAHPDEMDAVQDLVRDPRITVVSGGATRQESVRLALQAVRAPVVFIHDGARPWLHPEDLDHLKEAMVTEQAALLAVPVTDTIKEVRDGYISATPQRSLLWAAQTPQAFDTDLIRACHAQALAQGSEVTDDCMLAEKFGGVKVKVVPGNPANRKITTAADLADIRRAGS